MVDDLDADDPGPARGPAASGRRGLLVLVVVALIGVALAAIFVGRAAPPPPKEVVQPPTSPVPTTVNPISFRLIGVCAAITDGRTYVLETFRIENDGNRPARLSGLHALMPIGGLTKPPVIQANDGVCGRRGTHDPDVVIPAGAAAGFSAVFELTSGCPYDLPPTAYLDGTSPDGKDYLFPYQPFAGLVMADFPGCQAGFGSTRAPGTPTRVSGTPTSAAGTTTRPA